MPKIFESPDGGKTVYSREFGDLEREIEWVGEEASAAVKMLEENRKWREIFEAAKTNSTLQDAIDRVKVIYELSKKDNG